MYRMLFEMAMGNVSFRLLRNREQDDIRELSELLQAFSLKLHEVQLTIHTDHPNQYVLQETLILEKNFLVCGVTSGVPLLLDQQPDDFLGCGLEKLVDSESASKIKDLKIMAAENPDMHESSSLSFRSAGGNIPAYCTFSRLIYSDKVVVSAVIPPVFSHKNPPPTDMIHPHDPQLFQQLFDYILSHLEDPLPTTKELSKMFGTNEFNLKGGFRYFFKTSIYHLYHEERLKKAHRMILETNLSIKEIALSSGFNDYVNFYKAFRKRFGYAPGSLNRNGSS